jgi:glycosyltransferase involved in cell wall biosynthesis
MAKEPSVTIVVSVKNGAWIIKKCVDALLDQTYPNKKIFIIDNMSTDDTYDILKSYGKKISLDRVKGWVPKVHNYALKRVDTDFIAYTDADCIARKDWLEKLVSGFTSDDIVAVAGYAGTPKSVNNLQRLIGRELDSRWEKFQKFIPRAPTMNLCVRTEIAKKVKFDENFFWGWETDFGYRLTALGKMRYMPAAKIQHHHRGSWKGFFKQQMNNAKIQPFIWRKHRKRIAGDHISTSKMGMSLLLAYLSAFFVCLSLIFYPWIYLSAALFAAVLGVFTSDSLKLKKKWSEFPILMAIFFTRTIAWMIGIPIGFLYFFKIIKNPKVSGYAGKKR